MCRNIRRTFFLPFYVPTLYRSTVLPLCSNMPKKNKRGGRRSRGPRKATKFITYSGKRSIFPNIAIGTPQFFSLQPNILDNGVLANISDTFQLYRCTSLSVKMGAGFTCVAGYYNGVSDSPPGSAGDASSLPYSATQDSFTTVGRGFRVPREFLLAENSMKWWRTRTSTAGTPTTDTWENTQGTIVLFPLTTLANNLICIEFRYTFEFADPMVIGMTPHPRPPPVPAPFYPSIPFVCKFCDPRAECHSRPST